ncbi:MULTISPECIES: RteC domain-containing protein, partial [Niastella]
PTSMPVEAAPGNTSAAAASPALRWTGHRRDLVEIGYALYLHGDFGDASIKEIMESFEVAFNFELGEYYDHFTDIRQRKNSTIFLDKLKTHLVRYIEREDD